MKKDFLIIGYGNELRRDDGAGPAVARAIELLHQPGVRVLVCHQLTPELAEAVAQSDLAVFVDATERTAPATELVHLREIQPCATPEFSAHAKTPEALLAASAALFGHCPRSWLVTIAGTNFSFGEQLSASVQRGVVIATARVRHLCRSALRQYCSEKSNCRKALPSRL